MLIRRHCERSEAIHCSAADEWIASSLALLAMTIRCENTRLLDVDASAIIEL